jgi:hypothetical protein
VAQVGFEGGAEIWIAFIETVGEVDKFLDIPLVVRIDLANAH